VSDDHHERVGSVAEEAVKLLGALQDWAKDGADDVAAGAAHRLRDVDAHLATGGADCRYCPVCQILTSMRRTSPEVREHLTAAAGSLLHAAAGILETFGGPDASAGPGRDSPGGRREPMEKIDLDDDTAWED
jgi:hypothetical protein